jgi:Flp pilus assembly protein TadG
MLAKLISRFRRDERGNAGLLFGLAAIPMFAMAGGVVDYMQLQEARTRLQTALDAATLAASGSGKQDPAELRAIVSNYVRANYRNRRVLKFNLEEDLTVTIEKSSDKKVLRTQIRARFHPVFLSLLGFNRVPTEISAEAKTSTTGFEIALVLDNTGSMEGSKMQELKQAAKELIDGLSQTASETKFTRSHVALVPYNVYVNVGKDKWRRSWLDTRNVRRRSLWYGLVGMREAPNDILDDNYDTNPVPAVRHAYWGKYASRWIWLEECVRYNWWGRCKRWKPRIVQKIQPLTDISDESKAMMLKRRINRMEAFSGTNIPLGLVWGWRVLSSQVPYAQGLSMAEARRKNVRKIIVLMTDGWNSCFSESLSGYASCRAGLGPVAPEADERMRALCRKIRQAGIGIITIGYDIPEGSTTEALMQECQNLGYYRSDVGELIETFRKIKEDITTLHLSG